MDIKNPPGWRQLLPWLIPALLAGGVIRAFIMAGWQAGLYFGPDSKTYWIAVFRFFCDPPFDVPDKRTWLYPVLMLLSRLGPGSVAFNGALIQHLAGWTTILPFGWLVRRLLPAWKWVIIPASVLYACHPQLLYWEHVLIADSLFVAWTIWAAWGLVRYWDAPGWGRLGLVALVIFLAVATRPVGRGLWLGMLLVVLIAPAFPWRKKLYHFAAAAALAFPAFQLTRVAQGEDLLFLSTLPLVDLDNPSQAGFKKELKPFIMEGRQNLWKYVTVGQRETWGRFLDRDSAAEIGSVFAAMQADTKKFTAVRKSVSREAILHRPLAYLGMMAMKIYYVYSVRDELGRFRPDRWTSVYLKFITRGSMDPRYPGFLLSRGEVLSPDEIARRVQDAVPANFAQKSFLRLLPALDAATTAYQLPESSQIPWPDRWTPLFFIAIGLIVLLADKADRGFAPVLVLAVLYMALTFFVGRAVGRYRLPVEFAVFLAFFAGCGAIIDWIRQLWKKERHGPPNG